MHTYEDVSLQQLLREGVSVINFVRQFFVVSHFSSCRIVVGSNGIALAISPTNSVSFSKHPTPATRVANLAGTILFIVFARQRSTIPIVLQVNGLMVQKSHLQSVFADGQ